MLTIAHFITRLPVRFGLIAIVASAVLSGCGSDKPNEEKKKDNRTPQERVLVLKQRFDQLEASLREMKHDVEIQKKRIESTQKIVDSIKHSLVKGGLKGYSIGNISTTDPLVLEALRQHQEQKQKEKKRKAEKEEADNTILNALLIACFLVFIVAIFVAALKDKKSIDPVEPTVWEPTEPDTPGPLSSETEEKTNDTGSYEYGELRPPAHPHESDNPEPGDAPGDKQ